MTQKRMTEGVMARLGWILIGGGAIATGGLLGTMLGSISQTASTTLSVVTGMGAVLGSSWIANQVMKWTEVKRPQHWTPTAIRVGFIRGAINLAVVAVLIPITIWRVGWPDQDWPLLSLSLGIGIVAAGIGGLIAARVVAQAEH